MTRVRRTPRPSVAEGGLPESLRLGPTLLVAPHLDDAALSCAALLDRGAPIDVLTVFAGMPNPPVQGSWDRTTGFRDSAASMPVRISEERAALADGHRLVLLDLVEWQYLRRPRGPGDARTLTTAIWDWLEGNDGGVVALPAGAGRKAGTVRNRLRNLLGATPTRHPDHLFVRDNGLRALEARPGARAVFYEEFPYRLGAEADREVGRVARARSLTLEKVVVPVDTVAKAARIAVYETQIPHLRFGGLRLDAPADLPHDERYWLLAAVGARGAAGVEGRAGSS